MGLGKTTTSIGRAAMAVFATACTQAPEKTGSDQVYDANVTLTALKDNHFEQMSWEDVDNLIVNELVPNPASEPGCAVGIVRDGEILYLQGYGYARMPGGGNPSKKWGVGTMGAVASVSKTITAAALLSMVDDGDLSLNDIVGDFLPTTNALLANRTLESLITHASGVGGATQAAAFSPDFEPTSGAFLCQTNPGLAPPGYCFALSTQLASPVAAFTQYEATEQVAFLAPAGALDTGVYSNVGMSVAGAVIDAVAQSSTLSDGYEAYVWDEVGQ